MIVNNMTMNGPTEVIDQSKVINISGSAQPQYTGAGQNELKAAIDAFQNNIQMTENLTRSIQDLIKVIEDDQTKKSGEMMKELLSDTVTGTVSSTASNVLIAFLKKLLLFSGFTA